MPFLNWLLKRPQLALIDLHSARYDTYCGKSLQLSDTNTQPWKNSHGTNAYCQLEKTAGTYRIKAIHKENAILVDSRPQHDFLLQPEQEYTLQFGQSLLLIKLTNSPRSWISKIDPSIWYRYDCNSQVTSGPFEKTSILSQLTQEPLDPHQTLLFPQGATKGFIANLLISTSPTSTTPAAQPPTHNHCPHCWASISPGTLKHIATHESLRGDLILGPAHMQRFTAQTFDDTGFALDDQNCACKQTACPECHLPVSPALLEMPRHIFSIIGSPGAGKSYFLTTLLEQFEELIFQRDLGVLKDGDPLDNAPLSEMRRRLFHPVNDQDIGLAKTPLDGELYQKVRLHGRDSLLPRPFSYILEFASHPPLGLTFYDNAGEHFQPSESGRSLPVTHHLSYADAWFFLFDPGMEPAIRQQLPPEQQGIPYKERQENILAELDHRARNLRNLTPTGKLDTPLAFIIGKQDLLDSLEDFPPSPDCFPQGKFDPSQLHRHSDQLRNWLLKHCPRMVRQTEAISHHVTYFTCSALGHTPAPNEQGLILPDTRRLKPRNVELPLFWWLTRQYPHLAPSA